MVMTILPLITNTVYSPEGAGTIGAPDDEPVQEPIALWRWRSSLGFKSKAPPHERRQLEITFQIATLYFFSNHLHQFRFTITNARYFFLVVFIIFFTRTRKRIQVVVTFRSEAPLDKR
ncbi:hypothetical protein Nepgr_003091 [Nepenthes gracilis]|uniref:Uncharacterized protein n=1 Tax=Nepenthes gracilis TaxID=150966 RepID=A0AAD3RYX1_NEPGR|nr:hypothetical protein Nepgr_003091 [Nepenthes gracilis]